MALSTEDVIENLRHLAHSVELSGGGQYLEYHLAMEAIEEIKRLQARIAELERCPTMQGD
jgi:hypothetical protein